MCKNAEELMSLIDEMAGAGASLQTAPQNYDNFIRTRDLLKEKVKIIFDREQALCKAIKQLNTLIQ
jgi:hypothetical protein